MRTVMAHLTPQVTTVLIITPGSHVLARTGITALANAILDMGALTKFDISKNDLRAEGGMALAAGLKGNQVITELNIGSSSLGLNPNDRADTSGVAALADVLPGMRAISSINLLKNQIPVEQAQALVKIMQAKENLTTLCGLSREETELDFSGQYLGAGDAVLIANDISDMGALSVLNLASNNLGEIVLAAAWRSKDDDDREPWVGPEGQEQDDKPGKSEGIIAIANAIPDMGAMTSLNLASNNLDVEGAKFIAAILLKCT
jgi:Ran GTPase-activating protein (RanGAP) involved in mRNA processing and transport